MKPCIFLIILEFTYISHSFQIHPIYNESNTMCSISHVIRKRALEYTRWRANQETSSEFIVKVLDEDIIPKIIAVNIQPEPRLNEKIVVGGALVPQQIVSLSSQQDGGFGDYTRFRSATKPPVTQIDNIFIAPLQPAIKSLEKHPTLLSGSILKKNPKYPQGNALGHLEQKHIQRDESPPASPQFIVRSQTLLPRQYAPVAPVSFVYQTTESPLRPYISQKIEAPTRTIPFSIKELPTRRFLTTKATVEYKQATLGYNTKQFITSSATEVYEFAPTTSDVNSIKKELVNIVSNNIYNARKYNDLRNTNSESASDSVYNMLFYNDDEDNYYKKSDQSAVDVRGIQITEQTSDKNVEEMKSQTELVYIEDYTDEAINDTTTSGEMAKDTNLPLSAPKDENNRTQRKSCSLLRLRKLNFNWPRTLPEIVSQMQHWAEESPIARWVDITSGNLTTMENPIYMMIVDDPSSGQIISAKQTVMIVSGIQGRDHHAVTAALYVLYQLIERSEAHADLLSKYRFWIVPVFNPDGYDYSMTFPRRREWTKNLRQTWETCKGRESCKSCEMYGIRCVIQPCYGVNLDRNFEYQWIPPQELRSEHPCGDLYAGSRQLSELETKALTTFLHEQRTPMHSFIAFKEGEVLGVMYPYSHTKKRRSLDHVYRKIASRAAAAANGISGRPYVAGQTSEFLPLFAGGIEDWVDGHLGIDNTYTIMMYRLSDSYNTKLITERVFHEAYAAMDTLLLQNLQPKIAKPVAAPMDLPSKAFVPKPAFINMIVIVLVIMF